MTGILSCDSVVPDVDLNDDERDALLLLGRHAVRHRMMRKRSSTSSVQRWRDRCP